MIQTRKANFDMTTQDPRISTIPGDPRDYSLIPKRTLEELGRYVEHGERPNDFLVYMLANQLDKAIGAGDLENLRGLVALHCYLYNHIPEAAWGSQAKVSTWIHNHR